MNDTLRIITNNIPRGLVAYVDLPESARSDFDYVDEEEHYSPRFAQYRGEWYDTNDMMPTRSDAWGTIDAFARDWDAYLGDSFFSGILVRLVAGEYGDYDTVVMGRYYT
jgi:hypothetical protein